MFARPHLYRRKSYRITAGQGVARRSKLLEILATVQARTQIDFEALQALVNRESEHLTALLLIFPDWNEERRTFLTQLRAQGLQITVFIIADSATEQTFRENPVQGVHLLHLDNVARDLTVAAAHLQA